MSVAPRLACWALACAVGAGFGPVSARAQLWETPEEAGGEPAAPAPAAPEEPAEEKPPPVVLGDPAADAPAPVEPEAPAPADAEESTWTGPRVELSYRNLRLSDYQGGGSVNAVAFTGFLPTRPFRGGGGVDFAIRDYEFGPNELVLGGHVFAGYQHLKDLGRVVPFAVVMANAGGIFGKRFHTSVSQGFFGLGGEIGADVNLVRSLYLGLGLGFMHYWMDGLGYNTFVIRFSIGL